MYGFLGRQPYVLKIGFLGLVKQLLGVRGVGKIDQFFVESFAYSDE